MRRLVGYSRLRLAVCAVVACAGLLAPQAAAAQEAPQRRSDITIRSDAEFTAGNGVRGGSGTAEDPYVISNWDVSSLTIKDTSAHVMIMGNVIRSRLTLDWIGRGIHVHDNDVNDLRVNQNVPRTGAPTSGVIADNRFSNVGQLRHWDGIFENNIVGLAPGEDPLEALDTLFPARVFNLDGFNGAVIRNNTIYGYMDARLHGHHHSSGFGEDSHHHSDGSMDMDHSVRYHELWITQNTIAVPAAARYALSYLDTNHAANDRTATSEENPALNDPHEHYTRVHITDNNLVGSGLEINVFNAKDERHRATGTGLVEIARNQIQLANDDTRLFSSGNGISVFNAEDVEVCILDNTITAERHHSEPTGIVRVIDAGIYLDQVNLGTVHLYDNTVTGRSYGIWAAGLTESTHWYIDGLVTDHVDEDVRWENDVHNPPGPRSQAPCEHDDQAPETPPEDPHHQH